MLPNQEYRKYVQRGLGGNFCRTKKSCCLALSWHLQNKSGGVWRAMTVTCWTRWNFWQDVKADMLRFVIMLWNALQAQTLVWNGRALHIHEVIFLRRKNGDFFRAEVSGTKKGAKLGEDNFIGSVWPISQGLPSIRDIVNSWHKNGETC